MTTYKPTATLFLDTRKSKANDKFPLKLTIYARPDKKRYALYIDLSADEWKKINSPKLRDDSLKELKIKAEASLTKARQVLNGMSTFSFGRFEDLFFESPIKSLDLSLTWWFNRYIQQLDKDGREGTRISYKTTLNSLIGFKPITSITDVDKKFLREYETYMKKRGKSSSTIGIYLRNLRAIINQAIGEGVLKRDDYPFADFEIPGSRNIKKALDDNAIQLLLNHIPSVPSHKKALDFWILSYLCNGMNFTDIVHLLPENNCGNFLYFIRQKTIRTRKKDLRPIKVPVVSRAQEIISRWRNTDRDNPYLFSILESGLSPKTVKHRIQRFIKYVNRAMEEIRKELKINQKVGTYVARHTFSTRLMRKGVSTQYIKESLGHSSVGVTENYLGDFADVTKVEYANLLTTFD